MKDNGTYQNCFYEALMLKTRQIPERKLQINFPQNINTKVLNKAFAMESSNI